MFSVFTIFCFCVTGSSLTGSSLTGCSLTGSSLTGSSLTGLLAHLTRFLLNTLLGHRALFVQGEALQAAKAMRKLSGILDTLYSDYLVSALQLWGKRADTGTESKSKFSVADKDGDGVIDQEEFEALGQTLGQNGNTDTASDELDNQDRVTNDFVFNLIDNDQNSTLELAEFTQVR